MLLCCRSREACRTLSTQTLNVFVTMVGAGVVGLPYALGAASFFYGCISLVFALLCSVISLYTLTWLARRPLRKADKYAAPPHSLTSPLVSKRVVLDIIDSVVASSTGDGVGGGEEVAEATSIATYDDLVAEFLAPSVSLLSQFIMIVLLFLVAVLFIDVAHDSVSSTYPALNYSGGYPLRGGICTLALLFSLPRKLESLKFTSLFGFFSLFFLLVVIVQRWVQHMEKAGGWAPPSHAPTHITFSGFVFAVTTQLGAFAAAFNIIAAQAELPVDIQRAGGGTTILIISAGLAMLFYALFGIAGFLALDGNPPRDILLGFPPDDVLVSTARVTICAVCIFKAPLFANPLKAMLTARMSASLLPCEGTFAKSAILALFIFGTVFGISSVISDPSVCFGYVSAIGVNFVMFILPGLCVRSAALQDTLTGSSGRHSTLLLLLFGWAMTLFGILATALGLMSTIDFHGTSNSTSVDPGNTTTYI